MAKIKKAMKGGSKVSKGQKGKGIKETDKERDLRLEIERLKEEEAARAKEEMRKRMLRERQAQEEAYSRVNRLKIMNQWRKLMRLVKVEDLRKEIEMDDRAVHLLFSANRAEPRRAGRASRGVRP